MSPWLANIGAEEPDARTPSLALHAGSLFGLLFAADQDTDLVWPKGLDPPASKPAWRWLEEEALTAWLNTEAAAEAATAAGRELAGPAPDVVRRAHDKAFAFRFAVRTASRRGRFATSAACGIRRTSRGPTQPRGSATRSRAGPTGPSGASR